MSVDVNDTSTCFWSDIVSTVCCSEVSCTESGRAVRDGVVGSAILMRSCEPIFSPFLPNSGSYCRLRVLMKALEVHKEWNRFARYGADRKELISHGGHLPE